MKFLPGDKKKKMWFIILLVVLAFGIVYVNFFVGKDTVSLVPNDPETNLVPDASGGGDLIPGDEALSGQPSRVTNQSGLLPLGDVLDLSILESDEFLELQAGPEFGVTKEELGREDLFN